MKKILFIAIVILIVVTGCSKDQNGSEVQIRIKNISAHDFTDITVNTSSGINSYGSLSANQVSAYKTFSFAYRYAFVQLKINGTIFTLQPIDYVGESKLSEGKYTYEIDAHVTENRLILSLVKD